MSPISGTVASGTHAGLDFGTTNSTLGIAARGGPPRLLPVEGEALTIPSALFFSLEDGHTYFGRKAVSEYVEGRKAASCAP